MVDDDVGVAVVVVVWFGMKRERFKKGRLVTARNMGGGHSQRVGGRRQSEIPGGRGGTQPDSQNVGVP